MEFSFLPCALRLISLVACLGLLPAAALAQSQPAEQSPPSEPSEGNIIRVGEPKVCFSVPYANDHTVIYCPVDKKWHMLGIRQGHTKFMHLTADTLMQTPWVRHKDFSIENSNKQIWAPHIVHSGDTFYMFYTMIGEPREIRYAVSKDLFRWSDPSSNLLLAPSNQHSRNLKAKDPMVFRDNGKWIMYYSMMKDARHWVVAYSTSEDLQSWTAPKICFDEHTESPGVESPFVVRRGNYYYLFLSARPWPVGGEDVFRSLSPYSWDPADRVKRINPWHAAEVVRDFGGKWYLTLSSGTQAKDFRIAPLQWNDGAEGDTSMPAPLR